jgi:hypothetical protein
VLVLARASRDAALRVWQLAGAAARLKDAVRVDGIAFDGGRDTSDCLTRPEVAPGPAACRDVLADGTGLACGSPGMIASPGVEARGDGAPGVAAWGVEELGVEELGVEALGVGTRGVAALGVAALGVAALGVAARGVAALGVAAAGVAAGALL